MQHDGFYGLFSSFWWLLFPLAIGIGRLVRLWLRHVRAQQTLEVLKSYVDQGKEPPPEILKILQPDAGEDRGWRARSGYIWVPVFLFGALTCGFVFMAVGTPPGHQNQTGLFFVSIIMAGLTLGFLVAALFQKKAADQDRLLPK